MCTTPNFYFDFATRDKKRPACYSFSKPSNFDVLLRWFWACLCFFVLSFLRLKKALVLIFTLFSCLP